MEHALMPLEPRCDSGDELLSPGRRVHNLIGHPEGIGWIRVPVTENTDRVPGHRGRGRGCLTPAAYIANHHSPAPRAWVDVVEVAAHAEILGRRHVGGGDVDTRHMRKLTWQQARLQGLCDRGPAQEHAANLYRHGHLLRDFLHQLEVRRGE